MIDQYGRKIDYLRISVTDRCNLRCQYCMPDGVRSVPMSEILTYEEISTVVRTAAELGIRHIKLTGGEPLVRLGTEELVRKLKGIPGIESVTLTTNGILLQQQLPALLEAGLDAVNISLDTMDRDQYREITGSDHLETVLQAVRAACLAETSEGRMLRVKINAVSLALGEDNLQALIGLAKYLPVDVRFIEMMPIGYGRQYPLTHPGNPCGTRKALQKRVAATHSGGKAGENPETAGGTEDSTCEAGGRKAAGQRMYEVISHRDLLERLHILYPGMKEDHRQHGYGPAVYYTIPGYRGSIGMISAIHGKFCEACNRVRLTSQGYLKTCLCYNEGTDLRRILRGSRSEEVMQEKLLEAMRDAVYRKPDAHCFERPEEITESAGMNAIGG